MIMGGTVDRPPFQWFEQLSVRAFLALRPYRESIVALVSLMLDSGLPCFRGQTIKLLRQRFMPNLSDREAANNYVRLVRTCVDHWRANAYDYLQYYQNQIPCQALALLGAHSHSFVQPLLLTYYSYLLAVIIPYPPACPPAVYFITYNLDQLVFILSFVLIIESYLFSFAVCVCVWGRISIIIRCFVPKTIKQKYFL